MTGAVRALARLGRRSATRHPQRTALVVGLIALAVAAAVAAGIAARTLTETPEEQLAANFGTAEARATLYGITPAAQRYVDAALAELAPPGGWHRFRHVFSRTPRRLVEVTDLDVAHPLTAGMLELTGGRLPVREGELALTAPLLESAGVSVGDEVTFDLAAGRLAGRVVGAVRDPRSLERQVVVAAPPAVDPLAAATTQVELSWLIAGGPEVESVLAELAASWRSAPAELRALMSARRVPEALAEIAATRPEVFAHLGEPELDYLAALAQLAPAHDVIAEAGNLSAGHTGAEMIVRRRGDFGRDGAVFDDPPVISTLVAVLLLVEVGLLASAAYTTGVRRRLRHVGLLLANGATERQVRLAFVFEGVVAGLLGAALGVALGIAAGFASMPVLRLLTSRAIDQPRLAPADLLGPAAVGLVAAALAAWWPARAAGRLAPVTALHGRMPVGRPPRWLAPVAVVTTVVGLAMLAALDTLADDAAFFNLVVASLLAVGGAALLAVPLVSLAGRLAGRLPLLGRLALRDAGRQRARAAAGIAAIMTILILPLGASAIVRTEEARSRVDGLEAPPNLALVHHGFGDVRDRLPVTEDQVGLARGTLPDADVVMVPTRQEIAAYSANDEMLPGGGGVGVAVATPELLAALGADEHVDAFDDEQALLLGTRSRVRTLDVGVDGARMTAREIPVAVPSSFPRLLVSPDQAAELELQPGATAALLVLDRPLTEDEVDALFQLPAAVSGPQMRPLSAAQVELLAAGGASLLALVVIAVVLALSATESDLDLRTMVAVGAEPRLRRGFLGAQAALIVLLAAVLAIPLTMLLLDAVAGDDAVTLGPFGRFVDGTVVLPWPMIGVVLVAMPLAAAALTALAARSAPLGPLRRVD